jgi:riboflavin transporter FmnP
MQYCDEWEPQLHCSMLYLQATTRAHHFVGPWAKFNLQRQILILASLPHRIMRSLIMVIAPKHVGAVLMSILMSILM